MQHFRSVHNTFGCVGWLGRMAAVLGTFRGVHSTLSWRYPGAPGASTQRAHAGLRVGPGAHGGSAPRGDSLACAGKGLRWAGKCCVRFPLACAAKGLRWIGKCCINTGDCTIICTVIFHHCYDCYRSSDDPPNHWNCFFAGLPEHKWPPPIAVPTTARLSSPGPPYPTY